MIVSDLIVHWMRNKKVELAFGIPGGAITSLYNSLLGQNEIKTVLTQHECGAAYMSMGYNMLHLEKIASVTFSTSGPGATNLLTGIASAHYESVPMLVFIGDVSTRLRGCGAIQDSSEKGLNLLKMTQGLSGHQRSMDEKSEVLEQLDEAWDLALKRARPSVLILPSDVAKSEVNLQSQSAGGFSSMEIGV